MMSSLFFQAIDFWSLIEKPVFIGAIVFIAAYVRSYSGFGFALLAVPGLLLVLPPEKAIPLSIALDLLLSVLMYPSIARSGVRWDSVRTLLMASVPFIFLGLLFSHAVSLPVLYAVIGGVLLIATLLLMAGFRYEKNPSLPVTLLVGATSGFLGGIAGMFGPPVILFYASSPLGRSVSRASMMAFFAVCLVFALGLQIYTAHDWSWSFPLPLLLPFVVLGAWLGHRRFLKASEKGFKIFTHSLLLILALSMLVKAFPSF